MQPPLLPQGVIATVLCETKTGTKELVSNVNGRIIKGIIYILRRVLWMYAARCAAHPFPFYTEVVGGLCYHRCYYPRL